MDLVWVFAVIAALIIAVGFFLGRITVRYALLSLGVVALCVVAVLLLLPVLARHI